MAAVSPPHGPTPDEINAKFGYDVFADQSDRILAASVTLIILPTIFVILRFTSRAVSKAGFWWDDYMVLVGLVVSWGCNIGDLLSIHHGFGRHLTFLGLKDPQMAAIDLQWFLQILYGFEICYWGAVMASKISILLFYRRIFPTPRFRFLLLSIGTFIVATLVATTFTIIFECIPIKKLWNPNIPGHCVDITKFFLASGSINVVLDITIWIMPIPLLWRLRTSRAQKTVLTSIFLCGGFVCVVSIIRLVVLSRLDILHDPTWNYVNAALWSATEPSVAICCACLTTLRPLFHVISTGKPADTTQHSTSSSSSRALWRRSKLAEAGRRSFNRLDDGDHVPDDEWRHKVFVQGGQTPEGNVEMEEGAGRGERTVQVVPPKKGIQVTTEVVWSSTDRIDYQGRLF